MIQPKQILPLAIIGVVGIAAIFVTTQEAESQVVQPVMIIDRDRAFATSNPASPDTTLFCGNGNVIPIIAEGIVIAHS